jgi:hypothetical protein
LSQRAQAPRSAAALLPSSGMRTRDHVPPLGLMLVKWVTPSASVRM